MIALIHIVVVLVVLGAIALVWNAARNRKPVITYPTPQRKIVLAFEHDVDRIAEMILPLMASAKRLQPGSLVMDQRRVIDAAYDFAELFIQVRNEHRRAR